ncbi:MAG: hypothetical protein ABFD97_14060 [Syntrophobacter sp.]
MDGFSNEGLLKFKDPILTHNPLAVFAEVCWLVNVIHPNMDLRPLRIAFQQILRLFRGEFPGYRECNSLYHDLRHTTDCLLALTRLIHGAWLRGMSVTQDNLTVGLIAAALHDTGYIQKVDEISGTGAQFTLTHIDRGIAFLEVYAAGFGNPGLDVEAIRNCMRCTGLDAAIDEIPFKEEQHRFLGKALGTADLLGQMSDRTYVERLPLLYREFQEGQVPGYKTEFELIKKTPLFWEFAKKRLATALGGIDAYMVDHFRSRWGMSRNLYRLAIEENIRYLTYLAKHHANDYRRFLRRKAETRSQTELRSR